MWKTPEKLLTLWAAHVIVVDAIMGSGVALLTATLTLIASEF